MEDDLIESNRGLVKSIVQKFKPRNANQFDEYEQAGLIGLFKAIRKFDPTKGKLSTYAFYYIAGEIREYIAQEKFHMYKPYEVLLKKCYKIQERIYECIDTLSEIENSILEMRIKGYSFSEIGKIHGRDKSWANAEYRKLLKRIISINV